jgi:SAM-dependent methyltransferase
MLTRASDVAAGARRASPDPRTVDGMSDRDAVRAEQAASFDREAALYERARPGYPDAAVDWLLAPREGRPPLGRVLDLGAGTGKLTASIRARGVDAIAVDPSDRMLEQLRAAVPGVETLVGTAERIPLPDESVDAVFAAQAWHWVDEERALPEVARVLKPGGELGLVWNTRDDRVPWVRRLTEVMGASAAETAMQSDTVIGGPFGATSQTVVDWERPMTPDELIELALSRSYLITATPERRDAVIAGIRELLASDPALAGRDVFPMPYRTNAFRAHL